MIVFDLMCAENHRFEGWFASSDAFARQQERGLVTCPHCSSAVVEKAPMAPAVPVKGNAGSSRVPAMSGKLPPQVMQAMRALAEAQAKVLENSTWVGPRFAEESRAIHYGERDQALIHGQATPDEAAALVEEGIAVAPLPFPVAPPEELN